MDAKTILLLVAFCQPLRHMQVTSGFGWRIHPISGNRQFHAGVDLAADQDTVLAIGAGRVTGAGYEPGLGLFIKIDHGELESTYGHLSLLGLMRGDSVTVGEPIGLSGSTGRSTGPHLHFAISYQHQYIDPLAFLYRLMNADGTHSILY